LLLDSRDDDPNAERGCSIKRISELGPRILSVQYDVYQATLGLRGGSSMAGRTTPTCRSVRTTRRRPQSGNALTSRNRGADLRARRRRGDLRRLQPVRIRVDLGRMRSIHRRRRDQPRRRRPDRSSRPRSAGRSSNYRPASCARPSVSSTRRTNTSTARIPWRPCPAGRPSRHHWLQRVG
jgi:hypothetical protein